jgi:DNA-binding response OmpR family regulator
VKRGGEDAPMKLILIAEDDIPYGKLLARVITEATPYKVVLIQDAYKVLKYTQEIKPNLIILDYVLPHMNGIQLYDYLHARKELKDTPAIVISASLDIIEQELRDRNLISLSKPVNLYELVDTIKKLLAQRDIRH